MISKRSADLIFCGGNIITMEDPIGARPMDLAVSDGRILTLGNPGRLADLEGPETKIVHVGGKTLMPGLIDSHNHMLMFGQDLDGVDVRPSKVKNIDELVTELKIRSAKTPLGEWVKAWGYDDTRLEEKRHPVREDLDRACPNHPVMVIRTCRHVMVVNSAVLRMAGISETTPDPEGGKICRDQEGRPNGVLLELGAMNLVNRLIPNPDPAACARSLGRASQVYVREGLTLVTEAGAGWSGNLNEAAGFQVALQSGSLIPRVSMGLMEETYDLFPKERGTGLVTGFGNDALWIGPIKFVTDGGVGGRTAALTEPYVNSDTCGVLCENPENLTKRMEKAHRAGFQISVHAIGDRAIDMVLSAYESILSRYPGSHRHRIEHVTVCPPDFIPRIRKLGIVVAVQPAFLYFLGDSYMENLGPIRSTYLKPIKTMLKEGIVVAGGSDRPVTEGNPWRGICSAVNRSTITGKSINRDQRISTAEALKLYTRNGAFANFAENRVGTLTPGKLADIVVLRENPLEADPAELNNICVERTFINGREVWRLTSDER